MQNKQLQTAEMIAYIKEKLKYPIDEAYKKQRNVFLLNLIIMLMVILYVFVTKRYAFIIAVLPFIFFIARFLNIHRQQYFEELTILKPEQTITIDDVKAALQALNIKYQLVDQAVFVITHNHKAHNEYWTIIINQNKLLINNKLSNYPLTARTNLLPYNELKHNISAYINNLYYKPAESTTA